jgi:hypothetical protein
LRAFREERLKGLELFDLCISETTIAAVEELLGR